MADTELLTSTVLVAQAEGAGAEGGGKPADKGGGGFMDSWIILPLMAMALLFYFIVIIPERKKKKQLDETLNNLKENQRVVTIGGIVGSIVQVSKDSSEVVLRVDEKTNTKIRVLRSAIARPLEVDAETAGQEKTVAKEV